MLAPWLLLGLALAAAAEEPAAGVLWTLPPSGAEVAEDQAFVVGLSSSAAPEALAPVFRLEGGTRSFPARWVGEPRRAELLRAAGVTDSTGAAVLEAGEPLPSGARLRLDWQAASTAAAGAAFSVRGAFAAKVECERASDGSCSPVGRIGLRFSAPVRAEAAARAVLEEGRPPAGRSPRRWPAKAAAEAPFVREVAFNGRFPPASELRAVLPAGLRDDAGRTLGDGDPLALRTTATPAVAAFPSLFSIVELGAEPTWPITVWNAESATARLFRVEGAPARTGRLGALLGGASGPRLDLILAKLEAALRPPEDGPFFSRLELAKEVRLPRTHGRFALEVVGIPLPEPGFYVAEVSAPSAKPSRAAALVTNLSVVLKRGARSTLVWVTTLDRGEAAADAEVLLADCEGKALWRGRSDAAGLAFAEHDEPVRCEGRRAAADGVIAAAWKDGDFSFSLERWAAPVPADAASPVEPERAWAWAAPRTGPPGEAAVLLPGPLLAGATAELESAWAVPGSSETAASARLEVLYSTFSVPPPPGLAGFVVANGPFRSSGAPAPGQTFELAAGTRALTAVSLPLSTGPLRLAASLEVSVSTEGAVARSTAAAPVWPSSRLVGLALERGRRRGGATPFIVVVVDPRGNPAAGAPVKVELLRPSSPARRRLAGGFYGEDAAPEPVRSLACAGTTDRHGRMPCSADFPSGILEALTEDEEGRASWAHLAFAESAEGDEKAELALFGEAKLHRPGESAAIEAPAAAGALALVTLERGGALDAFVQRVSPRAPVVRVPLRSRHAPGVRVSVLAARGRTPTARPTASSDPGRPRVQLGWTFLEVEGSGDAPSGTVRTAGPHEHLLGRRRFGRVDEGSRDGEALGELLGAGR